MAIFSDCWGNKTGHPNGGNRSNRDCKKQFTSVSTLRYYGITMDLLYSCYYWPPQLQECISAIGYWHIYLSTCNMQDDLPVLWRERNHSVVVLKGTHALGLRPPKWFWLGLNWQGYLRDTTQQIPCDNMEQQVPLWLEHFLYFLFGQYKISKPKRGWSLRAKVNPYSGWWFGTFFIFPFLGIIIPID